MKILAIDCSAVSASSAIVSDDKVMSSSYTNVGLTHSQTLVPMINATLSNAQISIDDIDCFAINAGPGSFTGVRIGVAALKGIAAFSSDNCIAASTLESMAYNYAGVRDCVVVAAMDARCSQVYTAIFKVSGDNVVRLREDDAILIDELYDVIASLDIKPDEIVFVGDGAHLCYDAMNEKLPGAKLAPSHLLYQNAVSVAKLAAAHIKAGEKLMSSEEILPTYLRAPQAERELKKKREKECI